MMELMPAWNQCLKAKQTFYNCSMYLHINNPEPHAYTACNAPLHAACKHLLHLHCDPNACVTQSIHLAYLAEFIANSSAAEPLYTRRSIVGCF